MAAKRMTQPPNGAVIYAGQRQPAAGGLGAAFRCPLTATNHWPVFTRVHSRVNARNPSAVLGIEE